MRLSTSRVPHSTTYLRHTTIVSASATVETPPDQQSQPLWLNLGIGFKAARHMRIGFEILMLKTSASKT